MKTYLGVDTSNYTTSVALVSEDGNVLHNLKLPLPVSEGAAGLRQSDAVFAHVKHLPQLFEKLGKITPAAIGYSSRPSEKEGSYMPCFLSGEAVARALGAAFGVPTHAFSHQAGHIAAAAYSAGKPDLIERPLLAFHVSGGTTDLVYATPNGITTIGTSADLHAGQAVDRIGLLLGLSFPCGPALEQLALEAAPEDVPYCKICVKDLTCHLSGLENQAKKFFSEGASPAIVARYTLHFIMYTLATLTENARKRHPDLPVLYAGGVMSNSILQTYLCARPYTYFTTPQFSSDNAAGVALLCRRAEDPLT